MPFAPPSPPYLGPAKFQGGSDNKPIRRIVIHGTVSPTEAGGARNIARYFTQSVTRPSSAHYVRDPGETVQVVYDSVVAYHAPPNRHSIGYELCDWVKGPITRWDDKPHRRMLRGAAKDVARLCLAYNVPIRKIGPVALRLGRKGICGHVDVSNAWRQTSHWDPGAFPWRRFIRMVREEADALRAAEQADEYVEAFRTEVQALIRKYLDPAATVRDDVPPVRAGIRDQLANLRKTGVTK